MCVCPRCIWFEQCPYVEETTTAPITTASYDADFDVQARQVGYEQVVMLLVSNSDVVSFDFSIFRVEDGSLVHSMPIARSDDLMRFVISELDQGASSPCLLRLQKSLF